MDATKQEQQIVNELKAVMKKYRHIGALHMVECVRIAWEKEMGERNRIWTDYKKQAPKL